MQKKIAIIIERFDVVLGGAERSVFELADALMSAGVDVTVLAAKGQTNLKHIHILCNEYPGKRVPYSVFAKVLKSHISQNNYGIVHSILPFDFADIYQPRGGAYAESVLRNAASYQNKLVESFKKSTAFANFRRAKLLCAEKRLCTNQSGPIIAALSQYVAKQFRKHYNVVENRIHVIPNGIKINKRISPNEADKLRGQILAKAGIKEADNPVFFLFAANNFRLKGLVTLIKAIKTVSDYNTERPAYLIVAGSDKSQKYRHLAEKLKIHQRIIFLGSVRNIQDVLSISDIGVLPTFYDPASRFILEALAAGKPVITTRFNGATDLFEDNRHGKIIDSPENIDELADAICYFTNTDNIKKVSHTIISDNLIEKVSIRRVTNQLKNLYDEILSKRRKV
ncbi:MAG: glycosyltransferase family 4 protein [Planctomycetota bacterium]|jgi:UDP-glucose:(heptosyl)LPS alpha-1,3-glucosyltransferase